MPSQQCQEPCAVQIIIVIPSVYQITWKFYDIIADDAFPRVIVHHQHSPKGGRIPALSRAFSRMILKLRSSNNVALEVGEGFTATVRVKEV